MSHFRRLIKSFIYLALTAGCGCIAPLAAEETPAEKRVEKPVKPALPPVSEEKAILFGKALVAAIQSGEGTQSLIDWRALIDRSLAGLNMPAAMREPFQVGVQRGADSERGLFGQMRSQLEDGGTYKVIRVLDDLEGTRVKIRLMPAAGGVNFHDYLLKERGGRVVAIDLRVALTGEDFSQTLRRILIPIIANENRGFLERLTGKENAMVKHLSDLPAMGIALQEGHPEKVAGIVNKFPQELRDEKFCLLVELQAAQALVDNDKSLSIIERYRRLYPTDAAIDFLSIDYYVLKNDLPQATLAAERFRQSMGAEACMQTMVADLQWQSGKLKQARASIDKAIIMEPDFVNAHWTLVTIALSEKDHATVRETLQHLIKEFEVVVDPNAIELEPAYAEFITSPEFDRLVKFIKAR